jgi:hypothetical protein
MLLRQLAPLMGHSDALFTFALRQITFINYSSWNVRQFPFGRQNIVTLFDQYCPQWKANTVRLVHGYQRTRPT